MASAPLATRFLKFSSLDASPTGPRAKHRAGDQKNTIYLRAIKKYVINIWNILDSPYDSRCHFPKKPQNYIMVPYPLEQCFSTFSLLRNPKLLQKNLRNPKFPQTTYENILNLTFFVEFSIIWLHKLNEKIIYSSMYQVL